MAPGGEVINAITGTQSASNPDLFSACGEFAVFGARTVAVLITGAVLLRSRDV